MGTAVLIDSIGYFSQHSRVQDPGIGSAQSALYKLFPWYSIIGPAVSALLWLTTNFSLDGWTQRLQCRSNRLTLHFAAYMAESIRAAIIGIDRSQMEASLSVGMTTSQAMRRIILPQATRVALPSLMNYFIDMIKSTSLAFTLGVAEIMAKAKWKHHPASDFLKHFLPSRSYTGVLC